MKVKNITVKKGERCTCGDWLVHWERFGKFKLGKYCFEANCIKKPEVAAHVQISTQDDDAWYIVPLCKEHGKTKEKEIEIVSSHIIVSADKSMTCEKETA